MLAISVDPPEKSKKVVEKNHLPFDILSDEGAKTVKEYGLLHHDGHQGDIAHPASFLIGRDGRVVWRHIAARVQDRVDPAVLLEELKKHRDRL